MSKKNQKVQLATMSAQAVSLLSGYSVAITALKKLTDAHKAEVSAHQENIKKLLQEVEESTKLGKLAPDRKVAIEQLITTLNGKIMRADIKFKEDKKPYVTARNAALALVPQNIYDGYVKAWGDGNTAMWNVDITAFLRATGVDVGNDVAVQNFANVMRVRCAGSRNASAKDTSGRLLSVKGQRSFDDTVMKTFIDYCVVEKRVLNRAEDGTITKVSFE